MTSLNKKSKLLTEEEIFIDILHSMGIDQYEPQVIQALSEYARRITSELLCDAKDYSNHAQKNDIDNDDMDLAIKLSMHRRSGIAANTEIMNKFARTINSQDLSELIDKERVLIKYPRKLHESLLQRSYTYIPGSQAYPDEFTSNDINTGKQMDIDNSNNNNTNNNNNASKEFKPMTLSKVSAQKTTRANSNNAPGFQDDTI